MPQANYRPAGCLKFNQYFFFIYLFSTATLIFLITCCWDCLYTKFSSVKNYTGPVSSWSRTLRGLEENKISRFYNLSSCPLLNWFSHWFMWRSHWPQSFTGLHEDAGINTDVSWKSPLCFSSGWGWTGVTEIVELLTLESNTEFPGSPPILI